MTLSGFVPGLARAGQVGFGPPPGEPNRVIVLILPGFGGGDQVSIAYPGRVSDREAQSDLSLLARDTRWTIGNVKITPPETMIPGSKPITTASFTVSGLADPRAGWLKIEPFVVALKRFRWIEITYLQAPEMRYRGIKDFENEFVKIKLSRKDRLFRFVVGVKDGGFERLNLPLIPERKETGGGLAPGPRTALVLGVALLGGIIVYLIARKKQHGS